MAEDLEALRERVAAARAEADEREVGQSNDVASQSADLRRQRLLEELERQETRGRPNSASDEVVLPGRVASETPSIPAPSEPQTDSEPKEGN